MIVLSILLRIKYGSKSNFLILLLVFFPSQPIFSGVIRVSNLPINIIFVKLCKIIKFKLNYFDKQVTKVQYKTVFEILECRAFHANP